MRALRVILVCVLLVSLPGCIAADDLAREVRELPDDAPTPPAPDGSSGGAASENVTVTITYVVDGDTMEVEYQDGSTDRVRLLGVDTPEVNGDTSPSEFEGIPDTQAGHAWLSGWGENASSYAKSRLAGRTVKIKTDPEADTRGSYGRLLVYIYVNGSNFNEDLLEHGYARLYETSFTNLETFSETETKSQSADRGLWGYNESQTTNRRPVAEAIPAS